MESQRVRSCCACGRNEGEAIASLDFWNHGPLILWQCSACRHIQVDPVPDDESMGLGCRAYYFLQQRDSSLRANLRHVTRGFRKGLALGLSLRLRGVHPKSVLEIGPADGFFSAGLKVIFPRAKFFAADIVPEVLEHVAREHGFGGVRPDALSEGRGDLAFDLSFDLIVARDLIEHLDNPFQALRDYHRALVSGGHFFFITPNGCEDVWPFRVRAKLHPGTRSELLLNHMHYFDPPGLDRALREIGFRRRHAFIYGLKWTRRGRGWKFSPRLEGAESRKLDPRAALKSTSGLNLAELQVRSSAVLGRLVVRNVWMRALYVSYCWIKERPFLRLPLSWRRGHEIEGLYIKD